MCGIAGIIKQNSKVEKEEVEILLSSLHERGPENIGVWIQDRIGLGHTRLSIIDLSEDANQPMATPTEDLVIVFNGEIFNYKSIREELIKAGCRLSTQSDTEVLLQGYHLWGMEFLIDRLDGMFAFALLDRCNNALYLARDIFGEKPLYYYHTKKELIFSSSIRSIWDLRKDQLTVNFNSIDYYLSELSVPQPYSIWNEIKQVKPGHFIRIDTDTFESCSSKYWEINETTQNYGSFDEIVNQVDEQLRKATIRRSLSDVSIGAFLSGGMDSGLVVSYLGEAMGEKLKTYTVAFKESSHSEHLFAEELARKYNTDHQTLFLQPDVLDVLPSLIEYIGEPFADASIIPSYYITNAISKDVKVAMSGDGGDEFFGGYNDYGLAYRAHEFYKKYPSEMLRNISVSASKVSSRLFPETQNLGSLHEFNKLRGGERLLRIMGFSEEHKRRLYRNGMLDSIGFTDSYLSETWESANCSNPVDQLMRASLSTRLLNDYLVKVDRASMKNSLEVRSPFFDKTLAEMSIGIPSKFKFYQNHQKAILKAIAKRRIDENINQRPKRGFELPLREWLIEQNHWLKSILMGSGRILDFFSIVYIEQLFFEHMSRKKDHTYRLWSLICLELWMDSYIGT